MIYTVMIDGFKPLTIRKEKDKFPVFFNDVPINNDSLIEVKRCDFGHEDLSIGSSYLFCKFKNDHECVFLVNCLHDVGLSDYIKSKWTWVKIFDKNANSIAYSKYMLDGEDVDPTDFSPLEKL